MALKILDSAPAGETQIIEQLGHPAIVPIYETVTLPDDRVFYAMSQPCPTAQVHDEIGWQAANRTNTESISCRYRGPNENFVPVSPYQAAILRPTAVSRASRSSVIR